MKKKDTFAKFLRNSTDSIKELVLIYMVVVLLASWGFTVFEAMSFKDAVWMSFVTATSTGYGDFYPKSTEGRIIAVFLMHSIILVVAPLVVYRVIDAIDTNDWTDAEQEEQKRKQDWIIAQLESQTGQKYAPEKAS